MVKNGKLWAISFYLVATITIMKFNISLLILCFLNLGQILFAKDTLTVSTEIKKVTVFVNGAEIERSGKILVKKGSNYLLVKNLPAEINDKSIKVGKLNESEILSVKHSLSFPSERDKKDNEKKLEQKIEQLEIEYKRLANQTQVYQIEENLLLENSKLNDNKNIKVEDIEKAANFYRNKLNEIRENQINLSIKLDSLEELIGKKLEDLNAISHERLKTKSQVIVKIDSKKDQKLDFSFSYYLENAGWDPYYDFRVNNITEPLNIVYKANVFQSTGEDWKNVALKLSTNNPSVSGKMPDLVVWDIVNGNPYDDENYQSTTTRTDGQGAIRGKLSDKETGEALPFVNIILMQNGKQISGGSTDFDGNYQINPVAAGVYDIQVSFVGYNKKIIEDISVLANQTRFLNIELESGIELDAVEVVKYKIPIIKKDETVSGETFGPSQFNTGGSGYRSVAHYSAGTSSRNNRNSFNPRNMKDVAFRKVSATNYRISSVNNEITSISYDIDVPYNIPSDGNAYSIRIKKTEVPVEYLYECAPQINDKVYLKAQIIDWSNLNLMNGESNIFLNGTFSSQSFLDANSTEDTLTIDLGIDGNVVVSRSKDNKLNDKRLFGSNFKETVAWNIEIRNNKVQPISIIVKDQLPISRRKSVEIEVLELNGAKHETSTGMLEWKLNLDPAANENISYSYSLKYPKYQSF